MLTYHVLPQKTTSAEVARLSSVETVNGKQLPITAADGKVMVGNATVTQVDIPATNGVIHVIDTVLPAGVIAPGAFHLNDRTETHEAQAAHPAAGRYGADRRV